MNQKPNGWVLLTVLIIMTVFAGAAMGLHLQMKRYWELDRNVEGQMYSSILAENGIILARHLLPHLEVEDLLSGRNGIFETSISGAWRNPVPPDAAVTMDPSSYQLQNDDGLPFFGSQTLMRSGYAAEGGGFFFIKFSNNPEEPPDRDEDGIVLVRSLGVVPPARFTRSVNHTTLLEARLRQERPFLVKSPLTFSGGSGEFQWTGEDFRIVPADHAPVAVVLAGPSDLREQLEESLEGIPRFLFSEADTVLEDQTEVFAGGPGRHILDPAELAHFRANLPRHAESLPPGASGRCLLHLPDGGIVSGDFDGLLVLEGDVRIAGDSRIRGVVAHVGSGSLELSDRAAVRGGIWMMNPPGLEQGAGAVRFAVSGQASVVFDRDEVKEAQRCLPATMLYWRILFPEMTQ